MPLPIPVPPWTARIAHPLQPAWSSSCTRRRRRGGPRPGEITRTEVHAFSEVSSSEEYETPRVQREGGGVGGGAGWCAGSAAMLTTPRGFFARATLFCYHRRGALAAVGEELPMHMRPVASHDERPVGPVPQPDGAIPAVQLARVEKSYGLLRPKPALRGVSLRIARGECYGLADPNGSGKTTLISVMLGLIAPDAGEARLLGLPPEWPEGRRRVGFVPEAAELPPYASPLQLMKRWARG